MLLKLQPSNRLFLSPAKISNLLLRFCILFWIAGFDQLMFLPICAVGIICCIANRFRLGWNISLLLLAFVISTTVSYISIEQNARYFTALRNTMCYAAGFFLLSSLIQTIKSSRTLDSVIDSLILFSFQTSTLAFLAIAGITLQFTSLLGLFLPTFGSDYLASMLYKSNLMNEADWFEDGFLRPRGLMMYGNLLAGTVCAIVPLKIWRMATLKQGLFKLLIFASLFLDAPVVFASISRSAWLAVAASVAAYPLFANFTVRSFLFSFSTATCLMLALLFSGKMSSVQSRFTEKAHSNSTRLENYRLIVQQTFAGPMAAAIGHGSQRDHPGLHIPLGSHSTYLGILFKYGLLGTAFFALFCAGIVRLALAKVSSRLGVRARSLRASLSCALCILSIQMLFIEADVDYLYFSVWIVLIGCLHSCHSTSYRLESLSNA